jgi:lysozyme
MSYNALILATNLAKQFEGFSAVPYQDEAGFWTQGYGSRWDAAGTPITAASPLMSEPEAASLLRLKMSVALEDVYSAVNADLLDSEAAALADFVYNEGLAHFLSSTLLQRLNEGRNTAAGAEFLKWDIAGGKVSAGLERRRQAECKMFLGAVL